LLARLEDLRNLRSLNAMLFGGLPDAIKAFGKIASGAQRGWQELIGRLNLLA
jgi:hypothetical protein